MGSNNSINAGTVHNGVNSRSLSANEELASALESVYEQVQWQILIDGKPVNRIVSFSLTQRFNAHHEFKLCVYHSELEEPRAYRIDRTKDLLGKSLTVMMGSGVQDDRVSFTGIITGIAFKESKGLNGEVIVSGYSPTILLESGAHLHSFYQKNLQTISQEVTEGLAGKLEVSLQPRYREQLPYTVQHQESHFAFLNRLCSAYGEWFYYDGRKLCMGKPEELPSCKLSYVRHIEGLEMNMQVTPLDFTHLAYQSSEDKLLKQPTTQRVDGLNFYADLAVEQSGKLFSPVKQVPSQPVSDLGGLGHVTEVTKANLAGSTFSMSGSCKVPYLSPGTKVRIFLGETELGEYLITEVDHQLSNGHQYGSTFTAVAGDIQVIPASLLSSPKAEAQVGVVRKNDDPLGQGRVRVQFHWQEGDNMTDWIRVMSLDAGSGEQSPSNRGFMFVPEVGDQVMVGFEGGNPSMPFVLGSLFHGKNASSQGGKENHLKSITTKSGHTIEFDDSKESMGITIKDQSGNTLHIDTRTHSIHISAVEQISLVAKNIDLSASETLTLSAGENVSTAAGENISQYAGNTATISAKHVTTVADEEVNLQAKKIEKTAEEIKIAATKENLQLQSSKSVNVKSAEKVKLF